MEQLHYINHTLALVQQSAHPVILFQAASYAPIFFGQLTESIKSSIDTPFSIIDPTISDFAYRSQLETSFLGMQSIFWLGDCSNLKPKQKADLLKYLADYQGPHIVLFFLDTKTELADLQGCKTIVVKDKFFVEDCKGLWLTDTPQQIQKNNLFIQQLYTIKNSFLLDELCLLKKYQQLITTNSKEFYDSWVSKLVVPDSSLFTLSQLLFEKNEDAFFKAWLAISPLYSEMFWITFFSDQVYRAYFFIATTSQEQFALAKQISYGLSFSFTKQTYRQYQLLELQQLHDALYQVDTGLKNGAHRYTIDHLLFDFFAGRFAKEVIVED